MIGDVSNDSVNVKAVDQGHQISTHYYNMYVIWMILQNIHYIQRNPVVSSVLHNIMNAPISGHFPYWCYDEQI